MYVLSKWPTKSLDILSVKTPHFVCAHVDANIERASRYRSHSTDVNQLGPVEAYMRQAIIWTNAIMLLIGALETNLSENLIGIHTLSFN